MKTPSIAPAFCGLYPILAEHARELGYALCVHGTMARDLDLVAVPWTEEARPASELVARFTKALNIASEPLDQVIGPEAKPLGRLAWFFTLYPSDAGIDLSVIPLPKREEPEAPTAESELKRCPFCGSGAHIDKLEGPGMFGSAAPLISYSVVCNKHCYTLGGASSREDAIKAWDDLGERKG